MDSSTGERAQRRTMRQRRRSRMDQQACHGALKTQTPRQRALDLVEVQCRHPDIAHATEPRGMPHGTNGRSHGVAGPCALDLGRGAVRNSTPTGGRESRLSTLHVLGRPRDPRRRVRMADHWAAPPQAAAALRVLQLSGDTARRRHVRCELNRRGGRRHAALFNVLVESACVRKRRSVAQLP